MCTLIAIHVYDIRKPQRRATCVAKHKKEDRLHILHTYGSFWLGANPCNGARGNQKEEDMAMRRPNIFNNAFVKICVRFLQELIVRLILRILESLAKGEL